MKGFAVVVFCVTVAFVQALPQFYEKQSSNPTEDVEEIEIVPYGRRSQLPSFDDDPTRDIFTPDFTRSSFNPFANDALDSFVKRMNDLMEALQKRFSIVADRIPDLPQNGTLFVFGDGPVQNKSTSTTKVIDGNVVTVNETTFSTGDNVFHLEVIKVERKGTDVEDRIPSETTENTNVPPTTSTENSKPEENNEIPKEKVSFAEWDSSETLSDLDLTHNEVDSETFNEFDDVSVMKPVQVIDLSNDVLVNKLVSDQAQGQGLYMMDPNAEFIDVEDIKDRRDYFKYTPEKVVRI